MKNTTVTAQGTPLSVACPKAPYQYVQSEIASLDRYARIAQSARLPKR